MPVHRGTDEAYTEGITTTGAPPVRTGLPWRYSRFGRCPHELLAGAGHEGILPAGRFLFPAAAYSPKYWVILSRGLNIFSDI